MRVGRASGRGSEGGESEREWERVREDGESVGERESGRAR